MMNPSGILFVAPIACLLAVSWSAAQEIPDPNSPPPRWPGAPSKTPPGEPSGRSADQLVRLSASPDVPQVGPGEKFHLAFIFDIEPHWHIYWKNSGASGGPTTVQVSAPPGFTVGKTLYPRPSVFSGEEGMTYGYEDRTVLYVEVTAPELLTTGSVNFNAKINFMVCKGVCLLGRANQNVNVLTRAGETIKPNPLAKPVDPVVKEFKSRLPKPLSELKNAEAKLEDGTLTITVPASGMSTAQFFPAEMPGVTYDPATIARSGDLLIVTVAVSINPSDAMGREMKVTGTIGLGENPTDPAYDFEIPAPAT